MMADLGTFALVSLGMALTPGPNMIYLISRTILQGRIAGFISLLGVLAGFVFYMLCAAFGLTAMIFAVPFAYRAIQLIGAGYLLYLAWQSISSKSGSMFLPRDDLTLDNSKRLFAVGFLTNILNPKIALLYLSLLPQFIDVNSGRLLGQSLLLGSTQIAVSFLVNSIIIFAATGISGWFSTRPGWVRAQRWVMATILMLLALRVAFED